MSLAQKTNSSFGKVKNILLTSLILNLSSNAHAEFFPSSSLDKHCVDPDLITEVEFATVCPKSNNNGKTEYCRLIYKEDSEQYTPYQVDLTYKSEECPIKGIHEFNGGLSAILKNVPIDDCVVAYSVKLEDDEEIACEYSFKRVLGIMTIDLEAFSLDSSLM